MSGVFVFYLESFSLDKHITVIYNLQVMNTVQWYVSFYFFFSRKEFCFFFFFIDLTWGLLWLYAELLFVELVSPLKQELSIALNMGLCLALDFMMTSKIFKVKWGPGYRIKWQNLYSDVTRHAWKISLIQPPVECWTVIIAGASLSRYQLCSSVPLQMGRRAVISLVPQDNFTGVYVAIGADSHLPWCWGGVRHLTPWLINTDLGISGKISRCLSSYL